MIQCALASLMGNSHEFHNMSLFLWQWGVNCAVLPYNLAANVPLTAIPNRESRGTRPPCESRAAPSSPLGETLRTKCGYSVRRRAVKTFKSAKGVWGKTRVFPHKQHIKSSRDYPPKQSGGLFRKHTTHLNYSFHQRNRNADFFFTA